MDFRSDINSLRAIAVFSVVMYHFGIYGFSGGFVGVDIFFVISGYLMTGIIFTSLNSKSFSLTGFVLSRAIRIFPALFFLLFILLILGWFVLPSSEYEQLSLHSISASTFVSNMFFWREAGYFDVASHEKLLLHTWSLSVEWQFYLIFPVFLFLAYALLKSQKKVLCLIILGFFTSLLLSIYITPAKPAASFYLLPTRAWEMLAGSIVFILTVNSISRASNSHMKTVEILGYLILIASIILFDETILWPGYAAILPVLGTSLIIFANQNSAINDLKFVRWLGERSYSIYLWHWIVCVILIYHFQATEWHYVIISFFVVAILSEISFKFIETKARIFLKKRSKKAAFLLLASAFVLLFSFASLIYLNKGFDSRLPKNIENVFNEINNKNDRFAECHKSNTVKIPECKYGNGELGIVVLGDSHAATIMRAVEKSLPPEKYVLDYSLSRCFIAKDVNSTYGDHCRTFVNNFISNLDEYPSDVPVLVANRLSLYLLGENEREVVSYPDDYVGNTQPSKRDDTYFNEMEKSFVNTMCKISNSRPLYILKPIPELKKNVPKSMGRSLIYGNSIRVSITLEEYLNRNHYALRALNEAAKKCSAILLDPVPLLCDQARCYGDKNGQPVYFDDDHLSERGAGLLIELFQDTFNEL